MDPRVSRRALISCLALALLAGCGALRQAQDDTQPPIAVAVGDQQNLLIHRFAISGTHGKQVGSLTLKGATDESGYYAGFWKYPEGGFPSKSIPRDFTFGATVSVVRKKV